MNAPWFRRSLAAVALAVAGCGQHAFAPEISPANEPQALPAVLRDTLTYVKVIVTIPNPNASPSMDPRWGYVSPATQSIRVAAGGNFVADVLPTSPGCKRISAGTECTFKNVPATAYTRQDVLIAFYDRPAGLKGGLHGHMLSFGEGKIAVRRRGQSIALALDPILDRITARISNVKPPAGSVTLSPIRIVGYDPDGYAIPGGRFLAQQGFVASPREVDLLLTQPNVDQAHGFTFVVGKAAGAATIPTDTSIEGFVRSAGQAAALRYAGRGGHDAVLTVQGPSNKLTFDVSPQPGTGVTIAIPAVGPASNMSYYSGELWYTEPAARKIAYVTTPGGSAHEIALPHGHTPISISSPNALRRLSYPAVVSETGNVIGLVEKSGRVREYALPTANAGIYGIESAYPSDVALFTERTAGKIGLLNNAGYFTEYNAPIGSTPTAIYHAFFTDPGLNAIGYFHDDGGIGEYPLPHPNSGPSDITIAGISDAIYWFTEANAPRVGSVDPTTGEIREYRTFAPLRNITSGPDFWIYATDIMGNVEMIDPTGRVTLVPTPVPGSSLIAIVGGRKDDLWVIASNATSSVIKEILY